MKIKTKILICIPLLFIVFAAEVFAATYKNILFEAYGLDTVAGNSTVLRTSQWLPSSKVKFDVKKPDGQIITISSFTNSNGIAVADFSDYYTRSAGKYEVTVRSGEHNFPLKTNSFIVYPNFVSKDKSVLYPSEQVVRSLSEKAYVSVKLSDNYGNPVKGHAVKLISSSDKDDIQPASKTNISDDNGEVDFEISSDQIGTVTYSAYDVNSDTVLDSRSKAVFFSSNDYIFKNGMASLFPEVSKAYFASGNSSGPATVLKFDDIPDVIHSGENISLSVVAKDSSGDTVINYASKIRFSVESENSMYVTLPEDYNFVLQDQGIHTFSLGFLFQQPGEYEVKVTDLNNATVLGEETFTVVSSGSAELENLNRLAINNPSEGTYSNNVQVISGTANAGDKIKIFDNDIEIASLTADISGRFSYTTGTLLNGEHKFYVANVNDIGTIIGISLPVDIIIDTVAPEISQVVLDPLSPVDPGTTVNVKLYIEDELSEAGLILFDNPYDMAKMPQGYYEADVVAPIEFGDYPFEFILVDQLGNESKYENEAVIQVGPSLSSRGNEKPGVIQNLSAVSGDSKVILNWTGPVPSANPVKNYRVYYGISPNQLTEAVDTFTASTTWYIANLQNSVEYYFGVVAVDTKGNVSENFDKIVSSIPLPAVADVLPLDVELGGAGEEVLKDMKKDVSDSGPEILWLILLAAFGGIFYCEAAKKKN